MRRSGFRNLLCRVLEKTRFYKNSAALGAERPVAAVRWIAQPGTFGIDTLLVFENAAQHEDFFTTGMGVRVELGAGLPQTHSTPS